MTEIHTTSDKVEFYQRVYGSYEQGARDNIQVKCPKCLEEHIKQGIPLKKRKLAIAVDSNVFHCWFCGYKGHVIKLLSNYASDIHFNEFVRRFADKRSIKMNEYEEEILQVPKLPNDFKMLAVNKRGYQSKIAISYLKTRGVTERDLWYYKFGISNVWPWANRVIMPSFDEYGELSYFVGRAIYDEKYNYCDSENKKKHIIFNELNIDWSEELTIVEGIFDLVKSNDNTVPLLGSDFSKESLLFMKIIQNNTPVLLALDSDMNDNKLPKIVETLKRSGVAVRVLDVSGYKDVGEMSKDEFNKRRESALVWDETQILKDKISRKCRTKQIL